ncbi:MAG: transglycosylase domain-containing protein [Bacillota bacterium]
MAVDRPSGARAARRFGQPALFWLFAGLLGMGFLVALGLPLPSGHNQPATVFYDCHGRELAILCAENREPATSAEIPLFLRRAVVATEDAGFYRHGGISLRGIIRAFWRNLRGGRIREGGSTITQQLARSLYLNRRRTIWRKLLEVYYAWKLELRLDKEEILTCYLDRVYFGEGAYGVKAAAATYFGREPKALNRAEQAFLAGVLRSPANYSPWRHPEQARARARVAQVLAQMRRCGYLTVEEAAAVEKEPLRFRVVPGPDRIAPYFLRYVQGFLAGLFPEGAWGLRVRTTLDPAWQAAAEAAVVRLKPGDLQVALVALDPATGAIRAMVGGRDFRKSEFNRVTQARRQPGSAFKPIVYACALEHGYTLATLRATGPRRFSWGNDAYLAVDVGRSFAKEELSLREALAASCNVVAVALGAELGPATIAEFAQRLGIASPLRPYLSLALGTSEVKPLELAAAYAAFANGGLRVAPFAVETVHDAQGHLLYQAHPSPTRVMRASTAFLLTQALKDVFGPEGTAPGQAPGRPAAGKTGTSDGNRDAWFAGYTPELVAVVHLGYDKGRRSLPGSGGTLAAPIWSEFVRRALAGRPARDFPVPEGVREVLICRETGELAGPLCPAKKEYFAVGTEPAQFCPRHRFVGVVVCRRSGLLPGPYCRDLVEIEVPLGKEPQKICDRCRPGLFEWLRDLFRRRRPGEKDGPKTPSPNLLHGP